MDLLHFRHASRRRIASGILAGLLGGVAGSGAKLLGEWIYPPRTQGQEPPPAILAQRLAGHPLSQTEKTASTQFFHWTTGSLLGAVYGGLAEVAPIVTVGYGVGFGLAVLLTTHESTLPLLGLVEPPLQQPSREQSSEILTHCFFGITVEAVRRRLRRRFEQQRSSTDALPTEARTPLSS